MQITFTPQLRGEQLTLSRAGDVLTLNGEAFDFSGLPDGASLPADAVASDWFTGDAVERINGKLHLTLIRPFTGPVPEIEVLEIEEDGPVAVPVHDTRGAPA